MIKPENGVAAPGNPAGTNLDDANIASSGYYKKVPFEKQYLCTCYSCLLLGSEIVSQKFIDLQNILIVDRSTQIFDPFTEKVAAY